MRKSQQVRLYVACPILNANECPEIYSERISEKDKERQRKGDREVERERDGGRERERERERL